MTYRSLLVLLDDDSDCDARVQIAMALARRMDCHLVGLAPTGLVKLPVATGATRALQEFSTHAARELRELAEGRVARFREACRVAGLRSCEGLTDERDEALSLIAHSHCSDLSIVSRAAGGASHGRTQEFLDRVVLGSARPTLILPRDPEPALATNALVAWDNSRESARALRDALPLLRLADRVDVVCWPEASGYDPLARIDMEALKQWLLWQGVAVQASMERAGASIGEAIRQRAVKQGADLLVMGAYGHSRWSEALMGGATLDLMRAAKLPVVMSH